MAGRGATYSQEFKDLTISQLAILFEGRLDESLDL